MSNDPSEKVNCAGWTALGTFALQNGLGILLMRYSKLHSEPFSSQVAVLMQELTVKLPLSLLLYALECGGPIRMAHAIASDVRERSFEWLQLGVPALLYTVQNTMLYVGFAHVEAAIGQVVYQSKILWTALFSVIVLGKRLTPNQWLALVVLACGMLAVQGTDGGPSKRAVAAAVAAGKAAAADGAEANVAHGALALVLAALCTSFASVYFEKMLKGASKPSLWLRNMQMATYSAAFAAGGVLVRRDSSLAAHGWLQGFGALAWASVIFQGLGGLLVAFTIKHADNILRGFAQGLALIVGALGSWWLYSFRISLAFAGGVLLVSAAIFLYGSSLQTPRELVIACLARSGLGAALQRGVGKRAQYQEIDAVEATATMGTKQPPTAAALPTDGAGGAAAAPPRPAPRTQEERSGLLDSPCGARAV